MYLQLNKVNTENRDLNNSIVEIQDSISDLENQLLDLQQQLSDSTAKNEELQENNDSLQSELEQLQSEVEFLKSIEPMSVTMYALEDCDSYSKPDESSDKVTTVEKSASLHVTGRTSNDWYRVAWGDKEVYIKGDLLSESKPEVSDGRNSTEAGGNGDEKNSSATEGNSSTSQDSHNTTDQQELQEEIQKTVYELFGPGAGAEIGNNTAWWQ